MIGTITRDEFEKRLHDGNLALTLIGMSNAGKSYWSARLAQEMGFSHICCDDLIEAEVGHLLEELGYKGGIADMAKWLGQPYDIQFAKNQQIYLDLEIATLESIISQLEKKSSKGNIIIDTTGSVVHTSSEICAKLKELTTVVYLEATPDMKHEMFERYIAEPMPVVWGDIYSPSAGELPKEALARCYPNLLAYRSGLYGGMSHVVVPAETARQNIKNADDFLAQVKEILL